MTAAGRAPQSQGPRLAIVVAVVIINVLGIGLILPVLPVLIRELSGGDLPSASSVYGWIVALYSLMYFLFGPMLGALSDRFGRRPVILFSLAGVVVDYAILSLAPNVWWIVAGRILGGIMGASITTASAYIADISPPEKRAQNFGLLGVAFGVGFVAGPSLGGFLGEIGSRVPFWAAAGAALLALFFAYFFLPESLVPANRKRFRLAEANPVGAFAMLARYPLVFAVLTVFALTNIGERLVQTNWVFYTSYRYGWGPAEVGISLAVFGVLIALVQGSLVRVVVPLLGEVRTVAFGIAVGAIALVFFAAATQSWMVYAIMVVYVLGWGNAGPAMRALVTRAVPANEQGLLQGAITSVGTAAAAIAAPLGGELFAWFIGPSAPFLFPGVAFALAGVLFLVALAVMQTRCIPAAMQDK